VNTDGIERFQRFAPAGANPASARKLDALLHLLSNLYRPVMLLGARGAGKTSLLRQLQARAPEAWTMCYIAADPNLTLSRILEEMSRLLRIPPQNYGEAGLEALLEERMAALEQRGESLVLLLDEAHVLMPGLLAAVYQFSRLHPAVKLIFSLRPEDMPGKTLTDGMALADAHPMRLAQAANENPCVGTATAAATPIASPAPQTQAGETYRVSRKTLWVLGAILSLALLETLALLYSLWREKSPPTAPPALMQPEPAQPKANLPAPETKAPAARDDSAWQPAGAERAAETHGAEPESGAAISRPEAPGNPTGAAEMPPALPTGAQMQASQNPLTDSASAPSPAERPPTVAHAEKPVESVPAPTSRVAQTPEAAKPDETRPPAPKLETPARSPEASPKGLVTPPFSPDNKQAAALAKPLPFIKETKPSPPPVEPAKPAPQRSSLPVGNPPDALKDAGWLMAQDPSAYSLQLIAVSRLASLADYLKRVPASDRLATFRSIKGFNDLYPLFYGIYPDLAAAKAAAAELPPSLGKPVARQLKSIQQEIQRTAPAHLDTPPSNP
jgi:septal ring-binding cell division protein DamX